MKLTWKLMLFYVGSAVLSVFLFMALALLLGSQFNEGYTHATLKEIAADTIAAAESIPEKDLAAIGGLLEEAVTRHASLDLELVRTDGLILYSTAGRTAPYNLEAITDRFLALPESLWSNEHTVTIAQKSGQSDFPYYLLVFVPGEAMKPAQFYLYFREFQVFFSLIVPVLLLLLTPYLCSLFFFSSVKRRLRKLNAALQETDLHGEQTTLSDPSRDEIGQLTGHYNVMAQRIRSQIGQIREFDARRTRLLADLSHDLRTPLTTILGYAETIRTAAAMPREELQGYIRIILQRSRYMDRLLNQLLDISRLDADGFEPRIARTNLSELVRRTAADYSLFIDERQVEYVVDIPDDDVMADIDPSLIERALRNLIDNALRHGGEGHYLEIGLAGKQARTGEEARVIVIWVKDRGKGVPSEERSRIFERFRQGDASRREGLGLGLAIVREVADAHGARVRFDSEPLRETAFYLDLPASAEGRSADAVRTAIAR